MLQNLQIQEDAFLSFSEYIGTYSDFKCEL